MIKKQNPTLKYTFKSGYTITEIIVVIIIIGILSALVMVNYGSWQKSIITTQMKSDLSGVVTAMENARNYGTGYPADVNTISTFKPSDGITLSGGSYDSGKTFCVDATSSKDSSLHYYANSIKGNLIANEGTCALNYISDIADITGTTTAIGSTLTSGTLTPGTAMASYQWQRATSSNGTYIDIPGATANTYILTPTDVGKFLKVTAIGIGGYTGNQTSNNTVAITDANWLVIGTQTWAKYNSNVGTMVTAVTAQTNNSNLEKYCYDDIENNCAVYGGLYQWNEAMQYSVIEKAKGICPVGAHVPTDNEWMILEMQLGMTPEQANLDEAWRGTNQGAKLKDGGSSGLNIPLAGSRDTDGTTVWLLTEANLWTSSLNGNNARMRLLPDSDIIVARGSYAKAHGFSVRCIGD